MEKRASKWLEMHSQRHRFLKKNPGGAPPNSPPMSGGFHPLSYSPPPPPAHGLHRSLQAFVFKCPLEQPLWVQP